MQNRNDMDKKITINELLAGAELLGTKDLQKLAVEVYDIFDQALIKYIEDNKFWNKETSLKSASYSAKGRCLKEFIEKDNHKLLSNWVDFARYGRYGKEESKKLEKFLSSTKSLSDFLNLSELQFELRIPKENTIINSATVESPKGFKTINLLHTDLILQKTDLLILTTTTKESPAGLFFDRLKEQCNYNVSELNSFYNLNKDVYTTLLPGNNHTGFRYLLILNLPKRESDETIETMSTWISSLVLSSLAILEIQEKHIKSVSMPVIRGHYMNNKTEYIELANLLLITSAKWLKKSEVTTEVNIGVYYKDEIPQWNEAMNNALGRASINKDHLIDEICKDLSNIIDKHIDSVLNDALKPLKSYLHQSDDIGIESIFIQGRKLVELMVSDLAKKNNLKIGGELMSNIEKFREMKMAPWLLSYMHTLRVFGNEGVHVRVDGKKYTPNTLSKSDLINGLTAIRALLIFWDEQKTDIK